MNLTARQGQCLDAIRAHIAEHGVSPSYEELGARLGITSRAGLHRLVVALEDRGAIRRQPYRARTIVVVEDELLARALHAIALVGEGATVAEYQAAIRRAVG